MLVTSYLQATHACRSATCTRIPDYAFVLCLRYLPPPPMCRILKPRCCHLPHIVRRYEVHWFAVRECRLSMDCYGVLVMSGVSSDYRETLETVMLSFQNRANVDGRTRREVKQGSLDYPNLEYCIRVYIPLTYGSTIAFSLSKSIASTL